MSEQEQTRKIKCPHCGWIRTIQTQANADISSTVVALGKTSDLIKAAAERLRAMLADSQLDAANAWIDMPDCPECANPYGYNVRTGETRK